MPIHEFQCDGCGRRFERLVRPLSAGPSLDAPHCPICGSRALRQLLSSFAVNSHDWRGLNRQQGRKAAQKTLTEQRHAEMEAVVRHHRDHD